MSIQYRDSIGKWSAGSEATSIRPRVALELVLSAMEGLETVTDDDERARRLQVIRKHVQCGLAYRDRNKPKPAD